MKQFVVIPAILAVVSEEEIPGNLHELSMCIDDGTYINKYLLLTNKQILKIYADKEKIDIDSIYLKEITGFSLKVKHFHRRGENIQYVIEKVELRLKEGIFEIEFDEKMQRSQDLDEQKINALKFVKALNKFIN
ncbi:unnamed protein product [marine sediment metagenome]|uniref:Uncharacterized protein n=1 Tax=marine sediment metagenome TaxID=412755 RepID=X1VC91_9ZZZZ